MRTIFMNLFYKPQFENLKRHADKVSECARMFFRAVRCHVDLKYEEFDDIMDHVARLESEADAIKRNIRGHLPKGILMQVDKFQYFLYLREQDRVIDGVEEALYWLSYKPEGIEDELKEDMIFLVEKILPAIEALSPLVDMAARYFRTGSEEMRKKIKSLIQDIRQHENEADYLERELIHKILSKIKDPPRLFYLVRLVETIGNIPDHAQNASDMMRAMIAR